MSRRRSTALPHNRAVPPVVWLTDNIPDSLRTVLPDGIDVQVAPPALPDHLGSGEMLIGQFSPERTVDVMQRIDGLRVVQVMSAGVDSIASKMPEGVVLCNGSGVHDASVAEWVVMAILAMRRRLPEHVLSQQTHHWEWTSGGSDLEGATVLIVGYGSIGAAVEERLSPFGAKIERVARTAREGVHSDADLPALLPDADVVVILVPLTPQTHHLVDAVFIERMKAGALLVNAARGPVVDTDALLAALQAERISAALDVTDPEPLPDDHPLWSAPNVLITPHIGGAVTRVFERGWRFAGEQVRRYMNGEPLGNVVSDGY
ncbi:MAG: 2-hydroxyacid dehydrogenase [Candidatus Dormibacteraeota bacterium]|nr:2-hydroxyacid dehydrogenase [Candidatus Dormibacteraeota bacterium]